MSRNSLLETWNYCWYFLMMLNISFKSHYLMMAVMNLFEAAQFMAITQWRELIFYAWIPLLCLKVNLLDQVMNHWSRIWHLMVPPKFKSLCWRLAHDVLPVRDNLCVWGVERNWVCLSCDTPRENNSHSKRDNQLQSSITISQLHKFITILDKFKIKVQIQTFKPSSWQHTPVKEDNNKTKQKNCA